MNWKPYRDCVRDDDLDRDSVRDALFDFVTERDFDDVLVGDTGEGDGDRDTRRGSGGRGITGNTDGVVVGHTRAGSSQVMLPENLSPIKNHREQASFSS